MHFTVTHMHSKNVTHICIYVLVSYTLCTHLINICIYIQRETELYAWARRLFTKITTV